MRYLPAVLVAAGIAVLSLMESAHVPTMPVGDKWSHAIAYFILAVTLAFAVAYKRKASFKNYVLAFVVASLYGLFMEGMQYICTVTRMADLIDWLADTAGALAGVVLYILCFNK